MPANHALQSSASIPGGAQGQAIALTLPFLPQTQKLQSQRRSAADDYYQSYTDQYSNIAGVQQPQGQPNFNTISHHKSFNMQHNPSTQMRALNSQSENAHNQSWGPATLKDEDDTFQAPSLESHMSGTNPYRPQNIEVQAPRIDPSKEVQVAHEYNEQEASSVPRNKPNIYGGRDSVEKQTNNNTHHVDNHIFDEQSPNVPTNPIGNSWRW